MNLEGFLKRDTTDEKILIECLSLFAEDLPVKLSDAIMKTDFGELSQKQYAIENNVTYSTVKSRIQKARSEIKDRLLLCCSVQLNKQGNLNLELSSSCGCKEN